MDHWNKLTGWCNWNGKNSIRIGWRPALDGSKRVQLGAYLKYEGIRASFMPEMDLGAWNYGEGLLIHIQSIYYGSIVLIDINRKVWDYNFISIGPGWLMHPYFGGVPKAPHDMKIDLQRL